MGWLVPEQTQAQAQTKHDYLLEYCGLVQMIHSPEYQPWLLAQIVVYGKKSSLSTYWITVRPRY
jgi:hypothetical protein